MVKRLWLFATLSLLECACFAQGACTTATEYQPVLCRIKLPRIADIEIEENGARSTLADDQNLDCSRFKLDAISVRRYFTKALQVKNEEDAHHTLDWLPCYASGTMRFTDGRKARWGINQSQTGSLVLDGKSEMFLYCPDCKFKPFLW